LTIEEILSDVALRLHTAGIPYAVGGSLASSAWGQMRYTNDADIAIKIGLATAPALSKEFREPYLLNEQELADAMASEDDFRSVQLLHMDEAFKIDLFVLKDGPYENSEIDRARAIEVSLGVQIRFCAPENIVISKLRWYDLGNRISDRQWSDIVQVLEIQKGDLDESSLDEWTIHYHVKELLDAARAQTFG
jgi:hypothetical protein